MTRREQLIRQMRAALNDLQNPSHFDREETITFTVADLDFEFDEAQINEELGCNG